MTDPRVPAAAARFGDVAAQYEQARPTYPPAAIADLVANAGVGPGRAVLDLAAGTGKLTRQLAALGAEVVAVEPSEGMRAQLVDAVRGVRVLDGTAEAIPLHDGSVDVVTVAQAFHWFDTPRALDEITRVLRRGGWLVLIWNERPETGWAAELWDLRHRLTGFDRSSYPGDGWEEVVAEDARFGPRAVSTYEVRVSTTVEAQLADSESRSYVHALDIGRQGVVLRELTRFLAGHPETAGREDLSFVRPCSLHLCRRLSSHQRAGAT